MNKTLEQRVEELEKRVAELEKAVQPECIAISKSIEKAFIEACKNRKNII